MKKGSAKAPVAAKSKAAVVPAKSKAKPVATATRAVRPAVMVKAAPKKVPAKAVVVAKPTAKTPAVVSKKPAGKASAAKPVAIVAVKNGAKPAASAVRAVVKPASPVVVMPAKRVKVARPKPEPIPVRLPPAPVRSDSKMARNKAGITTRELEHFRDLLYEKRREITGDVSSMETTALRSGDGNLSTLPMHMADTGTDNYEQEFTLGLVEKDRKLLHEINVALAKIQDGSYGICEGTGQPIAKPRLEAQPWAKYSIEHARLLERPQFRRAF